MRAALFFAACALAAAAPLAATERQPQISASNPLIGDTIGLDHVLLWAKDKEAAGDYLRNRLGFALGPDGSYGQGIRHNIIRFANRSFVEFLWLSDEAAAREGAPWAYDFVAKNHNGSNAFGIQVRSVDAAYKLLSDAGLRPDEPMAEALDPDGPEGPKPPIVNEWRFMFLGEGAAAGEPFFVEYKPKTLPAPSPVQPNGAIGLESVWIAVADLQKARDAYTKAGLSVSRPVQMPALGASGVALQAGEGEILLLAPDKVGALSGRIKVRGDHVAGIAIRVKDAKATKALLRDKLDGRRLSEEADGSLLVDATEALGVYFDFIE